MDQAHKHRCPRCGREFEHDNKSRMSCPGPGSEWQCSVCFVVSMYGPDDSRDPAKVLDKIEGKKPDGPCLKCGEPGTLVPQSVGAFSMGYALCDRCRGD